MQVKRIANKITKSYLMDPYAMMMHYKRAFKLLKVMKDNSAKVLILGNKNQFGISWKGRFAGVEFDTGVVDEKLISTAPKHYEMILCLDPVLYCRSLRKINLPVMMCATLREITEHPEILDVTDYLLPSPTRRHDAALRAMVGLDILGEAPQQSDAAPSDTASAASMSTMSTARLIEQGEAPQRADAAPSEAPPSSSTSTSAGQPTEQGEAPQRADAAPSEAPPSRSTSTSAGQPTEQGEAPQRADAAPSEAPPSRSTSTSAGQPTEQGPSRHEPREKPPEE